MTPEEARFTLASFRSLRKAVTAACSELDELKARIEASGGLRAIDYTRMTGGSGGKSGGSTVEKMAVDYEILREKTAKMFDEMLMQEARLSAVINQIMDMELWFFFHALLTGGKYTKDRSDPRTKQQVEEDAFKAFAEIASAQWTGKNDEHGHGQ